MLLEFLFPLYLPMSHLDTDRSVTPFLPPNSLQTAPHPPSPCCPTRWRTYSLEGRKVAPETRRPSENLYPGFHILPSASLVSPTPTPVMFGSASWEQGGQSWLEPFPPLPLSLPPLPLCLPPLPPQVLLGRTKIRGEGVAVSTSGRRRGRVHPAAQARSVFYIRFVNTQGAPA